MDQICKLSGVYWPVFTFTKMPIGFYQVIYIANFTYRFLPGIYKFEPDINQHLAVNSQFKPDIKRFLPGTYQF